MTHTLTAEHAARPQWATSSRLLKLGETISFRLYCPEDTPSGDLSIFPRYLELAQPGPGFAPGGALDWLDGLPTETLSLAFVDGWCEIAYTPEQPGSYLARWHAGEEVLYRYFSVIEDDWIVLRFSTFTLQESEPTLHGTGIPLDYRLPAAQFRAGDPTFEKFVDYNRRFGDNIVPFLPDVSPSSRMTQEQRIELYGLLLAQARAAMPFPGDVRSARIEMNHEADPGYTEALVQLGIHDHCGLQEANARPWLGMPEFPYFASRTDCRAANQEEGGPVVAHQWDFCGGWHFLGPVSWHFKAAKGDWALAEPCLWQGLEELANLAVLSGHPAFALPLYDGLREPGYPNPRFQYVLNEEDAGSVAEGKRAMSRFMARYQRFMAFEVPKRHKVVYARSIDIADYYRRHFRSTPRTVFVSKTDHVTYDMWWLCHWCNDGILVPRERIPAATRISTLLTQRREQRTFKDPLSYEYILVEDQRRSIRFERQCPNPIWWFDYTNLASGPRGSVLSHTETPDVEVLSSGWVRTGRTWRLDLKLVTTTAFPDYAIALWDVPRAFGGDGAEIQTNAQECVVAWNRDGEVHLVLCFDLKPDVALHVSVTEA